VAQMAYRGFLEVLSTLSARLGLALLAAEYKPPEAAGLAGAAGLLSPEGVPGAPAGLKPPPGAAAGAAGAAAAAAAAVLLWVAKAGHARMAARPQVTLHQQGMQAAYQDIWYGEIEPTALPCVPRQ
jgi:hypothetical protein